MDSFFSFFTRRHMLANVFTVMVILLGLGSLLQIKRDLFPNVDFGETLITTRYPGASAEDVELNVTNSIEEQLKSVSNIDQIVSYSMENISIVRVTVDVDTADKEKTKREIREAVARVVDLPDEVTDAPLVTEISTDVIPVIEVGIAGNQPYRELREYARLFKKKLENVPGVSRVEESWYRDREVRIELSHAAIEEYQIPLEEVAKAIQLRNIRSTGGSFESYTSEKNVVTLAQFRDPSDVDQVFVRSTFAGPAIRVSDIGRVYDDFEEPRVISRINGIPAIAFSVLKKETADIIRTDDAVKALIAEEQKSSPPDITILTTNDQSYYVRNRFSVVLSNGAIGLALVLLLLTLFMNIRAAFWVAVSIPVTLLGVIFLMPIAGAYLDVIALTAMLLVIGIIVDDGIIVAENIVARTEKGEPPHVAAPQGIRQVFKPVFTTLLTTFLAFTPMFFMKGVSGTFVFVIPLVISLALLISMTELVVALPTHLVPGLKRVSAQAMSREHWFSPVKRRFQNGMEQVLRFRYLFILLSIALFFGSIWYAVNHMQFILFPNTAANVFNVYVELPVGSSLQFTSEQVKSIEQLVQELPEGEVASFSTKIGTHGEREPGERSNWAVVTVDLVPFAERSRTAADIVEVLRERSDSLPQFSRITYAVDAGGPPVGDPITLRIVGSDDQMRRALTDSVVGLLAAMEGIKDIDRNDKLGKEQVELAIDYDALSRLGLTVSDIARTVRIAYDGEVVTSSRYGDEDVDFRVILERAAREKPETLSDLLVPNAQGRLISLDRVADLAFTPGPANYYHFDGERATTVTADIEPGVTTPVAATNRILAHFNLDVDYPGTRFVVGGEAEETAASFQSLYVAFAVANVAIYLVLVLLFDSLTQPFIVMFAIPFGIIGVVIAFAIHGQPLGFLALTGLVGLGGVAVNDSLVMVSHINRLLGKRGEQSVFAVIAEGVSDRLRAIIMTTLTTVVGLIPLVYGIGGSDPFIAPMALALGYGLLFATPLTLVFVPCIYAVRLDVFRIGRRILGRSPSA